MGNSPFAIIKPLAKLSDKAIGLFKNKIKKSIGGDNECWIWKHSLTSRGYGMIQWGGKIYMTHRIAFFINRGYDPSPLCVCHTCDNRACNNPKHLFAGTNRDNQMDKVSKGRQFKGENHPRAKLTEAQVRQIRVFSEVDGISKARIGRWFGVTDVMVGLIVRRKAWPHVA